MASKLLHDLFKPWLLLHIHLPLLHPQIRHLSNIKYVVFMPPGLHTGVLHSSRVHMGKSLRPSRHYSSMKQSRGITPVESISNLTKIILGWVDSSALWFTFNTTLFSIHLMHFNLFVLKVYFSKGLSCPLLA